MTSSMTPSSPDTSPLAMVMRMVTDKDCDPAKLREILQARREWMADEAAAAFSRAICDFQRECKVIVRGDSNNGKAYAKLDRIWREIRPLMDRCGLSITWEGCKMAGEVIVLDGHLRHSQGHAQPVHFEMPMPDVLKGTNAAQRMGSAMTYGKRNGTLAILGIQTGEDTDGDVPQPASASAVADVRALLTKTGKPEDKACAWLKVDRLEDASAQQIGSLKAMLEKAAPMKKETVDEDLKGMM